MQDLVELVRQRLKVQPTAGERTARDRLRPAAVLLPILVEPEGYRLLLTRRSPRLRRQPGDISFPGGAIDRSDRSALAAALRESEEEVGLAPKDVTLLGQMHERGTVTGFRITPFVGSVRGPYAFHISHEVAEILAVPIEALRDPSIARIEKRRLKDGSLRDVYHYQYQQHDIWGITGQLVHDFLELID